VENLQLTNQCDFIARFFQEFKTQINIFIVFFHAAAAPSEGIMALMLRWFETQTGSFDLETFVGNEILGSWSGFDKKITSVEK
jgi:hypothetical protein